MVDRLQADSPWYLELAGDPAVRRRRWQEFLLGEDPREEALRRCGWAVGDDGFVGGFIRMGAWVGLSIQLAQTWTKKTLHLPRRQVSWIVESAARCLSGRP